MKVEDLKEQVVEPKGKLRMPLPWWELGLYLLLIAVAGGMRFWDLGSRALHHDESLHAVYSWYLYKGQVYQHMPMMHGPFQFHGNAFFFLLFGDSDYTARILYALFGTVLVFLPVFLRPYLGRAGALAVAVFLAISPSFLYFSRFARNDILIAVWTLLLVIFMWRYLEERKPRYLYLGAAALALSFVTKETTYITVAIFGSFLLVLTAPEVWAIIRRRKPLRELSPAGGFLVMMGTLTLPQLSAGVAWPLRKLGVTIVPSGQMISENEPGLALAVFIVAALFALSFIIGLLWSPRQWVRCALIFYAIYILLYSSFFTNAANLGSGIWGSLDYWLLQQGVKRGGQPWYYYSIFLTIYEFLPLILATIGFFYYLVRGNRFSLFLAYWLGGAFILYSWAGEKMPWLSLNLALPLVLVAGKFLGGALTGVPWRKVWEKGGLYFLLLLPTLALTLRGLSLRGSSAEPFYELKMVFFWMALPILSLACLWLIFRLGARATLRLILVLAVATMGVFTVRAATQASYVHGDTPVEMLVYTQTSPDIPRLMRQIDELAWRTGKEKELPITVDSADGYSWPWAWYLRNYKKVDYPDLTSISSPPPGDVLLLNARNEWVARDYLEKYGPGQRFRLRWWFPEDYRGLTIGKLWRTMANSASRGKLWRFFLFRETFNPLGSVDAIAYFPKEAK